MAFLRSAWMWLLAASLLLPMAAAAQTPEELAAQVQAHQKQINNLSAAYQRVSRFVAMAGQSAKEVEASGELIWARPWNLRLSQLKPRQQLVVADQEKVWWVRPERQRADIYPTEQFTSGLGSLMDALGGLASLNQAFKVEEPTPPEKAVHPDMAALALIPKTSRADLSRLVVWFTRPELTLAAFRIINLVGDQTDYTLASQELNKNLPADTFSYSPPADFRLKDHRGETGQADTPGRE